MVGEAASVKREALLTSVRRIGHRGPDAEGVWIASDRAVGLAHARLAITDLRSGSQPMSNENGDIYAVVNGEFYGFESIRDELTLRGHTFRTDSDSEILVHLYEEYGAGCLEHLRGEFSWFLWDGRQNRFLAGRDRFGMKPLYYSRRAGSIVLASEVKALFAAGVPAAWDEESYLQHLFMVHGQERTLFKNVSQVPPGHFLQGDADHLSVHRYWDLDYPKVPPEDRVGARTPTVNGASESVAQYRAALAEAVRLRLRADVPVGCFLSGGIDSSAVLCLAATVAEKPLKAFTVTFEPSIYDEGTTARAVAERAGAEYHPIHLTHSDLADAFPDAVFHAETLGNMHGVARYLQSRVARDTGCKVALTGDGADETLAGYSHFRLDTARDATPVPRLLEGVRERLGFLPAWITKLASERAVLHSLISASVGSDRAYDDVYDRFLDHVDVERGCAARHPLYKSMYVWAKTILPNYSLCADRLEMAFSVECRHPFLDHRLFEVVKTFPPDLLIREGIEKYVLREAVRPFVPSEIYTRRKHPFTAPPATLNLDGPVMALMQDQLRGPAMRSLPYFEPNAVSDLLDQLPRMSEGRRVAYEPLLTTLLCTCLLQERYRL
jgi:asparagine synthase (glutamine-hydrolysing)